VGGTEEVERVLRVLPTRDDLLAVVIHLERREEDDLRIRPGCSSVLRRNSFDHVLVGQPVGPMLIIVDHHSKKLAVVKAEDGLLNRVLWRRADRARGPPFEFLNYRWALVDHPRLSWLPICLFRYREQV